MTQFATEFPIKPSDNKAAFPAEVFAWLRGMQGSTVLSSSSERELDAENVLLISESGEELRMRELRDGGLWKAIGMQHDIPDAQGRVWRTEAVLKRGTESNDQDIIRFRTQCLAKHPGAFLESPKKPFLIKSLLKGFWGSIDREIEVLDIPHYLSESEEALDLSKLIIFGNASRFLPVVYISATGRGEWLLNKDQITKLAYDLGGVAHIVVEPSRRFSYRLRDMSEGRNVYNGTLGIALPNRGFIRRFYLGYQFENVVTLTEELKSAAMLIRGFMPTAGWDWTELQEHALRQQRATLKGALSEADADQLFDDFAQQLSDLQEENRRLKDQLNTQSVTDLTKLESSLTTPEFFQSLGKEIYPGEIVDRIRYAIAIAASVSEAKGIDHRTTAIWDRIIDRVPRSPALDELLADLSRATKDPKRVASDLSSLLVRHGYYIKSDNKHTKLEPMQDFVGLGTLTVPKTPSEINGLKNLCKQIERTLGIGNLPGSPHNQK